MERPPTTLSKRKVKICSTDRQLEESESEWVRESAAGTLTKTEKSAYIHLHWVIIVSIAAATSALLHLFPFLMLCSHPICSLLSFVPFRSSPVSVPLRCAKTQTRWSLSPFDGAWPIWRATDSLLQRIAEKQRGRDKGELKKGGGGGQLSPESGEHWVWVAECCDCCVTFSFNRSRWCVMIFKGK